jgi:hypothetical protein
VLADLVACDQLTLTGYNGCGVTCMQQLCSAALASRWQLALDASAANFSFAEVPFEASGPSELDVTAILKGFTGSWLGNVLVDLVSAKVTGNITAQTPSPPAG